MNWEIFSFTENNIVTVHISELKEVKLNAFRVRNSKSNNFQTIFDQKILISRMIFDRSSENPFHSHSYDTFCQNRSIITHILSTIQK